MVRQDGIANWVLRAATNSGKQIAQKEHPKPICQPGGCGGKDQQDLPPAQHHAARGEPAQVTKVHLEPAPGCAGHAYHHANLAIGEPKFGDDEGVDKWHKGGKGVVDRMGAADNGQDGVRIRKRDDKSSFVGDRCVAQIPSEYGVPA